MSGKQGQKSQLKQDLPKRYVADLLKGVDGRRREARRWLERLQSLIEECGGAENLSLTEIEILGRYVHLSQRIGKAERRGLLGEQLDEPTMNDGLRSWLGMTKIVQIIKAKHQTDRDAMDDFFGAEEEAEA